jgi:hypothetical protein
MTTGIFTMVAGVAGGVDRLIANHPDEPKSTPIVVVACA